MNSIQKTSILQSKFIALDSSHLAVLIQEKYSEDEQRRESAQAFEELFNQRGCVLLLSWHHIEELLKHRNEQVVAQRIAFIRSLPLVAWISAQIDPEVPGSVVDILAHEVAVAFRSPEFAAEAIRDQVVKAIFRLDTGQRAIVPFINEWERLKPSFFEREARHREIISISKASKANFAANSKAKIKDLLGSCLNSPEDTEKQFQTLHDRLVREMRARGDKKIPNVEQTAAIFLGDVRGIAAKSILEAENPASQILLSQDIDLSDIGDRTTVEDVGHLATFRRKLRIINQTLELPWPDLKTRVQEDRVPSGVIQTGLRRYSQDMLEHKGSELSDECLACLAAYADITYVDKRTYENVRRARRKWPAFASIIRRVEKAADYREIAKHLAQLK